MTIDTVVLVDENDRETGTMEKIEAHRKGLLHRAFSVFILNSKGELLLQRRASGKYHSPGLWTNTCCSHPRPGEDVADAAHRRLYEEMGMKGEMYSSFSFIYRADFDNGLTEHEFDHVFIGISDDIPVPDESEVDGIRYVNLEDLTEDIENNPGNYTVWFRIAYPETREKLIELINKQN